ncbi:MAG: hypothetical protein H6876_01510 [Hyphomicrobiaceae bacterium]|nr:hypothetical protein [Hyphomicrobiaceae bacterium]
MRLSVLFALVLLTSLAGVANAEVLKGDGIAFDLRLPDGFCALSREHEQEKKHYALQDQMQRDHNGVLMIALPCQDVNLARTGKPWKEWMIWLLNGKPGSHTVVPDGLSRAAVVQELAKALPELRLDQVNSEVNKKTSERGLTLQMRNMSVLEKDVDALYSGQIVSVAAGDGGTRELAVVTGWLALKSRIVTLNAYAHYKDAETVKMLLSRTKDALMKSLAATEPQ